MSHVQLPEEFWEKLQAVYLKEDDGNSEAWEMESPALKELLEVIHSALSANYTFVGPLARGGAGLIVVLEDKRLSVKRALKVPRPREEQLVECVKNEAEHLSGIDHANIVKIHDVDEVQLADGRLFPYFVMDYVDQAKTMDAWLADELATQSGAQIVADVTAEASKKLACIADALRYLHSIMIIHFDIKPSNILVDAYGRVVLTDLGFAKSMSSEQASIVVGFTKFYAHPDLRERTAHLSSENRVQAKLPPKRFTPAWDIYAFGKTILHLLSIVDQSFPDTVSYDYSFVNLHLLACRMLDGRNLSLETTGRDRKQHPDDAGPPATYREIWLNLRAQSDYDAIKCTDSGEVLVALQELTQKTSLDKSIPELSARYVKRVHVSDRNPAAFSHRVKAIVEHPCFARLDQVRQLGLASSVYPGATHTRFEHSLGSFAVALRYVRALCDDPYNPFFRQVCSSDDLKVVLLASLTHDLGHYPLGHELEETHRELSHERLTLDWLVNPTRDRHGHTLRDIIENAEWGWGITIEQLTRVLTSERTNLSLVEHDIKADMLRGIIDGPIDVDKLDYLMRDTQNCFLPYGSQIDVDRLVANLTTIIISPQGGGKASIALGTYDKGQSAAESTSFARYSLYQSLYWHHALRAARAMIRQASTNVKKKMGKKTWMGEFRATLGCS